MHELHDEDLEPVGIGAERRDRGLHPADVAVMVGPEDVDEPVVAAGQLLRVVRDVRREVRRVAAGTLEDAVLVVARVGRAQPQRALGPVEVAVGLELLVGDLDRVGLALVQRVLREPVVERDPVGLHRRAVALQQERDALLGELVGVGVGRARDLPGQLLDVLPLVAALGDVLAPRAGLDRRTELGDLAACVVDVELALDGVAANSRSRESASPNAACRPLAAVSGPVGLADTNSTRIRSGDSGEPAPWRSPAATTSASAAACQPSDRKRLRKPGPATSTRSSRSPSNAPSSAPT